MYSTELVGKSQLITKFTPLKSIPRASKAVQIRTQIFPARKLWTVLSLWLIKQMFNVLVLVQERKTSTSYISCHYCKVQQFFIILKVYTGLYLLLCSVCMNNININTFIYELMKKFFSPFNGLNKNKNRWIETLKERRQKSAHITLINTIVVLRMILVHKRTQFNLVYFLLPNFSDQWSSSASIFFTNRSLLNLNSNFHLANFNNRM